MQLDREAVRKLAYRLWEERGRPEGRADEDWFAAERRLQGEQKSASRTVDEAARESFPASDPPASTLPDKPPANADAKWAAAGAAKATKKRKRSAKTAIREPAPGYAGVDKALDEDSRKA